MDLLHKLLNVFVMLLVFGLILPLNGMKERGEKRKRRRCPRVCLRELSKEYSKLKVSFFIRDRIYRGFEYFLRKRNLNLVAMVFPDNSVDGRVWLFF